MCGFIYDTNAFSNFIIQLYALLEAKYLLPEFFLMFLTSFYAFAVVKIVVYSVVLALHIYCVSVLSVKHTFVYYGGVLLLLYSI